MNRKDKEVSQKEAVLTIGAMVFVVSGFVFVAISVLSDALMPPKMITRHIVPSQGWTGIIDKAGFCMSVCPELVDKYVIYRYVDSEYNEDEAKCNCYLARVNITDFSFYPQRSNSQKQTQKLGLNWSLP